MMHLSSPAQALWAKKGKPGELTWLPLHRHMADAAGVVGMLWDEWLSDSERHLIASGLSNPDQAYHFVRFLAASHDLGKATPLFQAKPKAFLPDDLDEMLLDHLQAQGLPLVPHAHFSDASKTPHALATQTLLLKAGCNPAIAAILGAHHGKPTDSITLFSNPLVSYPMHFYLSEAGKPAWSSAQEELLQYALQLAGCHNLDALPVPAFSAQVLLSGLVIVADWIASNERLFPYETWGEAQEKACPEERLDSAWKQLDLPKLWTRDCYAPEPDYYLNRFQFEKPHLSQQAALDIARNIAFPGIFILEAPMGTGKTEAALVVAEVFGEKAQKSGVFFALPTQATSNAIFPRLLKWAQALNLDGKHAIRLAHGKAQFHDEYQVLLEGSREIGETADDIVVHQWFEGNKKSLLADFVVGTIDQFLLAALRQKHVMLRHLGLSGKVLILDECHAYDAYMNKYLDQALRWMGVYRVPVVILSATLPARRRAELVQAYLGQKQPKAARRQRLMGQKQDQEPPPAWTTSRDYPLITWTDGSQVHQEALAQEDLSLTVALERLEDDNLARRLQDLLQHGGYAGVMVNTVKRAQDFYQELKEVFGGDQVTLVHARFITPDRVAKEAKLLKMLGKPADDLPRTGTHIVVGTQVIEQSLDLDFDVLVSDLCPMDLLLQRMGRLHRHKRRRPSGLEQARCIILGAQAEHFEAGAKAIYKAYPLMRTKALLPQHHLTLPEDIPRLVQDVYDQNHKLAHEPPGYGTAMREWQQLIAGQEGRASAYLLKAPSEDEILNDWLADCPGEAAGEASVRDGGNSVEALVIRQTEQGGYAPLPWVAQPGDGMDLPGFEVPDKDKARLLARQSLRLPFALCHEGIIDRTILELEQSSKQVAAWQQSPWLKGQLFLILHQDLTTTLCGFRLSYQQELGLLCENEGSEHGKQSV